MNNICSVYTHHTQKGAALFTSILFFTLITTSLVMATVAPTIREYKTAQQFIESKSAYTLAESGTEDVYYRLKNNMQVGGAETLSLNGYTTTITVTDVSGGKEVLAEGDVASRIRKTKMVLSQDTAAPFSYAIQGGADGVHMEKEVEVDGDGGEVGNIYSNGPIIGDKDVVVTGNVVSAGSSGLIRDIEVGQDAKANTIEDSFVGNDAYYQSISGTTVQGSSHPGSSNPAERQLPLSDGIIGNWKSDAAAGGIIAGDCPGTAGCSDTMGPVKIDGDLTLSKDEELTLTGVMYVTGDIDIAKESEISCDSAYGANSCALVADGWISVTKETSFEGSGHPDSYLLLITTIQGCTGQGGQSPCAPGNAGMSIDKEVEGSIFYATDSQIVLDKEVELSAIAGEGIRMKKEVEITYETGVSGIVVSSGVGSTWKVGTWEEVQ